MSRTDGIISDCVVESVTSLLVVSSRCFMEAMRGDSDRTVEDGVTGQGVVTIIARPMSTE